VRTANSALSALEQLPQFEPDLLISDIGMPNCDGYELLRRVRFRYSKDRPSTSGHADPVAIALTAFASETRREDALRAGFAAHLTKPVSPEELVRVILRLMQ